MTGIRKAATIVLLRAVDGPSELFFVKRHKNSGFMPSAYVYPGGQLDQADTTPEALALATGRTPSQCATVLGEPPLLATGLFLAGVRESFEEAGLVFARGEAPSAENILRARKRASAGQENFWDVCARWGIEIPLDEVHPYAHWITPPFEKRRFDTHFFVAVCPSEQALFHDNEETTDSEWMSADEALERFNAGRIFLAPPTVHTLMDLRGKSCEEILSRVRERRRPAPTILPELLTEGGNTYLVFPGDPAFSDPNAEPASKPTRLDIAPWGDRMRGLGINQPVKG